MQDREAFRYLGVMLSPTLNWDVHCKKVALERRRLTRQVKGATFRPIWGPEMLAMAAGGKIGGYSCFHLAIVPVPWEVVQAWDAPLAKALSSSYSLGYGVSQPLAALLPTTCRGVDAELAQRPMCGAGAASVFVAEL